MGSLHGKVKTYMLCSRAVERWNAVTGGLFMETLENLPARVHGTNIRNYLLGLVVNFQGTLDERAAAPRVITAREIHNLLGAIQYKDSWGMMVTPMAIDRLTASNFSEGIQSHDKHGTTHGFTSTGIAANYQVNHSVFVAYSPKFFANKEQGITKVNGVFPVSMLGKEAELLLAGVGAQLDADCVFTAAPQVTLTAVVWQSRELIVPTPTQIVDVRLSGAVMDPYVEEGEPRKIEDLLVLGATVSPPTVPIGFWTSAADLSLDFDGNGVLHGPSWMQCDALALGRNHDHAFRGINDPGNAAAAAGIFWDNDYYQGNAATLIDADGFEQATQGRSVRRLELRGHVAIEGREALILIQRKRFECPGHIFDQWCEREGIRPEARANLILGSGRAKDSGLSRGEAMGCQMRIGSRKDRRQDGER